MEKIERVEIEAVALTDQGPADVTPIVETIGKRLSELGYVAVPAGQPADILLRAKCEQRKTWDGPPPSGGEADLPDSPSRVWKGPACQLTYLLDGKKMGWWKEVRTEFVNAVEAAATARAGDPGAYAMAKLRERLEQYDFPVLLAADWGQEARLLKLLDDQATQPARKVRIISLLGEMFATEAVPRLLQALKSDDSAVAKAAAMALGNIGSKEGTAALIAVLKTGTPELQAAAAKGLGQLGALHGDFSIIPPLLNALNSPDVAVKTEAAWALGKLPDRRAYDPLHEISKTLTNVRGPDADPSKLKLKEAVYWSMKQIDTWEYLQ